MSDICIHLHGALHAGMRVTLGDGRQIVGRCAGGFIPGTIFSIHHQFYGHLVICSLVFALYALLPICDECALRFHHQVAADNGGGATGAL